MTIQSRPLLPLARAPHAGGRSAMTCHFRCADQCSQPRPNTSENTYFGDIVQASLSRRSVLGAGLATVAVSAVGAATPAAATPTTAARSRFVYDFAGTAPVPDTTDSVTVPKGFAWKTLVRWGDPIIKGAPRFDFEKQTAAAQEMQFGYNCDYVGMVRTAPNRAMLAVNNEYTNDSLMFRGYSGSASLTKEQLKITMAAHGMSIVELYKTGAEWKARMRAPRNRRITASTPFRMVGPAAGSPLLRTKADPGGRRVLGTFGNCSGGMTPWGTILSGEENFHGYFAATTTPSDPAKAAAFKRYGLTGGGRGWERVQPRFDTTQEPNEPNRFGYIIEVDPTDPNSTPRKLTNLGRFKHEGANVVINHDGHVAAYTGDDEAMEYMYKFLSSKKYIPGNRKHNMTLLEEGDLFVARFTGDGRQDGVSDGTGQWIPLVQNGKSKVPGMSLDEVLVHTRMAADLVNPTKMDRPEDVEVNLVNKRVYAALTNNSKRTPAQIDEANPRANNKHGQILEITCPGNDHRKANFTWKLVLICGDPSDPITYFNGYDKSEVSPISCPDNLAFDSRGNLWISTDGNNLGNADGFFMMPLAGAQNGHLQQFLTVPVGAESAGPLVVDDTTVFCAVQHPGEVAGATPDAPASRFPYDGSTQPRPSVIQVYVK